MFEVHAEHYLDPLALAADLIAAITVRPVARRLAARRDHRR